MTATNSEKRRRANALRRQADAISSAAAIASDGQEHFLANRLWRFEGELRRKAGQLDPAGTRSA